MKEVIKLKIAGMTCESCVVSVKNALKKAGALDVELNLQDTVAEIKDDQPDLKKLIRFVKEAGYGASKLKSTPVLSIQIMKENHEADLIVVGGGSAGFAASIRASELGAKVTMINSGTIGGTCVNIGCVPSKALIRASMHIRSANNNPFTGVESEATLKDFAAVMAQKDALVGDLRQHKYIDIVNENPNITLTEGKAYFESPEILNINGESHFAPRVILSTGALPALPDIPGLSEATPLNSTTAFELIKLPKSMIILGGRYIAVELASIFNGFGTQVTILQRSSHLLPDEDEDVSEALRIELEKQGVRVVTGVAIKNVSRKAGVVKVSTTVNGGETKFEAVELVAALGRRAWSQGLALEKAGIEIKGDETVSVNEYLETARSGVYAAGDLIGEPAFVYTAAYEGALAAENALNGNRRWRDYTALPWVIFGDPQMAGVGLNEKEAAARGPNYDVSVLPMNLVPRALAARDTRGFVKLIRDKKADQLLGARIFAPEGSEQIMEAALAIKYKIPVSEIAAAFHPYLTQSEAIKLCAQGFTKDVNQLSCCAV